jgi:hypothetical protein
MFQMFQMFPFLKVIRFYFALEVGVASHAARLDLCPCQKFSRGYSFFLGTFGTFNVFNDLQAIFGNIWGFLGTSKAYRTLQRSKNR